MFFLIFFFRISPNLRRIVYCNAIKFGGQEEWEFAWRRYLNANVGSEKNTLLDALGCSREVWILSRFLEWAVKNDSGIRKQDVLRVFESVSSNVVGKDLAFNFLRNNWSRIKAQSVSNLKVFPAVPT